ncbi:hypothetical protein [Leptolyngbya sp. 7M]|uniref:hypothetical protein n=1 Tax=Leptolyngbya sp. 7M TaxID=2812896 RepID=UPI001B8CA12B|nr:hypothetical protein [Leptolyngbya sp. 7M]QYO63633.1 hypothetical protein JVX88_27750 [Leptolyngbya sp. 7M]
MNYTRLIVTSVAIFIFALLWNGLIHAVVLQDANAALVNVARPAAERNMGLALLLTAGLAFLFVWSYAYTAQHGTLREGIAHGLFFAVLAGFLVNLNQYILYPLPASLVMKWFVSGLVEFCIYGGLASWLYPIKRITAHSDERY